MKLSNKSRYGLKGLTDLAVHGREGQVSLKSIAERNNISLQYLEQAFSLLRKAGIVKSVKGPQGGYYLDREADEITLAEILECLEGSYRIYDEDLTDREGDTAISLAIQKVLIDPLNERIERFLRESTLADLEEYYLDYENPECYMYYI